MKKAKAAGASPEEVQKLRETTSAAMSQLQRDMEFVHRKALGLHPNPGGSRTFATTSRALRVFSFVNMLGQATISSMSDPLMISMRHGGRRTARQAASYVKEHVSDFKLAREKYNRLAQIMEVRSACHRGSTDESGGVRSYGPG